jgi:polyisoprenoid-binding protein YceI
MIQMLYKHQDEWMQSPQVTLRGYAQLSGITPAEFDECLKNDKIFTAMNKSIDEASSTYKVESTPTFFVGTTKVTGDMTAAGSAISAANVTVDMASVASGEGLRDSQFQGRIMQTSQFPTSSFALKSPIDLGSVPADQAEITVKATGTLTLHGVAKDVTIDLSAKRNGATIEVLGTVPITFSDYNISNPSGGPATVGDSGEMEFHVILTK